MIFLVSLIPESYAQREMQYTRDFLNRHCKKPVARCVTKLDELKLLQYDKDDYFVIADYKAHPYYFQNKGKFEVWSEVIEKLPKDQIVVWLGDARFRVYWDDVYQAIGSYDSTFNKYDSRRMKGFHNCFYTEHNTINDYLVPMTWKDMLRELKYNYSLSETQCYPGEITVQEKKFDLTYIMYGTIKHRQSHLEWLRYLTVPIIVGNWNERTEAKVVDFVDYKHKHKHPVTYRNIKVFGKDWIELVSQARYTIIADDDYSEFPAMLSARFWEAIRGECIPLIYEPKDPNRNIYKGFDCLQSCCYFNNAEDLQRILSVKPMYHGCIKDMIDMQKQIYFGEDKHVSVARRGGWQRQDKPTKYS